MSGILFSTVVNPVFVAKSLISGILFSTVVNAVFVARLLELGFFFSNYALFVSYLVFNAKSSVSILSTFETNLLHAVFLTT